MKNTHCLIESSICLGLLAFQCEMSAATFTVNVPGISDPWLAGMPNGTTASENDRAPAQSPVLVTGLSFAPGMALTFSSSGGVGNSPVSPDYPPEGNLLHIPPHLAGAENGIANARLPMNCLLGLFLGPNEPNLTPVPSELDFRTQAARDYLSLRPDLKQVFFIGDGRTSDGRIQEVIPPAGATRLFLGTMDESTWLDNHGSFSVTVTETNASVPPTLKIQVADVEICWPSNPNVWYQVEYHSTLTTNAWVALGGRILGTGSDICIVDSVRTQARKFYRLSISP